MTNPPVIIQKMAGRHFRWWCKTHQREATVLKLMPPPYRTSVQCVGDGILLPCDCDLMQEAA